MNESHSDSSNGTPRKENQKSDKRKARANRGTKRVAMSQLQNSRRMSTPSCHTHAWQAEQIGTAGDAIREAMDRWKTLASLKCHFHLTMSRRLPVAEADRKAGTTRFQHGVHALVELL